MAARKPKATTRAKAKAAPKAKAKAAAGGKRRAAPKAKAAAGGKRRAAPKAKAAAGGKGGKRKGRKPMSAAQKQAKAAEALTALGKSYSQGKRRPKKRTGVSKKTHPNIVRANKATGAKRKGRKLGSASKAGTPAGKAYAKAVRGPQAQAIRDFHASRKWMALNPGKSYANWVQMRKRRAKAKAAKNK